MTLTFEAFGFEPGTLLEISGSAVQGNGATATFHDVQRVPFGGPGGSLLTVKAVRSTETEFRYR